MLHTQKIIITDSEFIKSIMKMKVEPAPDSKIVIIFFLGVVSFCLNFSLCLFVARRVQYEAPDAKKEKYSRC
jgi:hypothetical protein